MTGAPPTPTTAPGIRRVKTHSRRRGGRVAEGGGLLNRCTGLKPVPWVRIPSPPPFCFARAALRRMNLPSPARSRMPSEALANESCSYSLSILTSEIQPIGGCARTASRFQCVMRRRGKHRPSELVLSLPRPRLYIASRLRGGAQIAGARVHADGRRRRSTKKIGRRAGTRRTARAGYAVGTGPRWTNCFGNISRS